jgi:uncharacterized repeat protein (TIGR03803 family)
MQRMTVRDDRTYSLVRILLLGIGALMATILAPHAGAAGYREEVLHRFCVPGGGRCPHDAGDGIGPRGGLIGDMAGNLYGTTVVGGNRSAGVVFELTPDRRRPSGWAEEVLYSFCQRPHCVDGRLANAGLIIDAAGNLYGTTSASGGAGSGGTVFELTPNATRTEWTETVLHRFCARSQCADGRAPAASLIMDAVGNLYGTTVVGGANDAGTVFELTPNANGAGWTETVLYSFCRQSNCTDGAQPEAGLIFDAGGNLYGTTQFGGGGCRGVGCGTAFMLTPPTAGETEWTETVVHKFRGGTDGATPFAGLAMDAAGNLYGTTQAGGVNVGGTVFALTPNVSKSRWRETVLYRFCTHPQCADGRHPEAGLIVDAAGKLYGTTTLGGAREHGVVFVLTPDKTRTSGWTETVVHTFCRQNGCPDGEQPQAGLIADSAGNLYGTTSIGGILRGGVVFKLVKSP